MISTSPDAPVPAPSAVGPTSAPASLSARTPFGFATSGSRTVNVVPTPNSLSTWISPPISWVRLREME